jgi:hypothetical protein
LHDQKFFDDYAAKVKVKETSFFESPYTSVPDRQWKQNTISLKISGFHASLGDNYNQSEVLKQLYGWIGKPTVIIGYEVKNIYNDTAIACGCQADCKDCHITFLQTFGMLTDVKATPDKESQPQKVDLSISIYDFWKEIDNYSWELGVFQPDSLLEQQQFAGDGVGYEELSEIDYISRDCENYFSKIPSCEEVFGCKNCLGFKYRNWANKNYFYNEQFWYDQFNAMCSEKTGGIAGIGFNALNAWHVVNTDIGKWNAPPQSLYSISGLPDTGILSIVTRKRSGLAIVDETSYIDLDELDADLVSDGYTSGIETTDRVLVGDIRRVVGNTVYKPSFIEKAGIVIGTKPVWYYNEWFPGMLAPGFNRFYFDYSGSGDTGNLTISYVHHFRRI